MLLEGVFLPLTVPFHPDGRLFARKLEANVARYSLTPAAGLLIGHMEADMLNDSEAGCVLESAVHAAAETKVMIAGVSRESLAGTLHLAQVAAARSYDVIAVRVPSFAVDASMRAEVMNYFRMIADRSSLPVLIDAGLMPCAWIAELAQHPNILGAMTSAVTDLLAATNNISREVTVTTTFAAATGRMLQHGSGLLSAASLSSGNMMPISAPAVKTRRKKVGFQVLATGTAHMLAAWRAGASGAVPRLGPCAPQACCEVWQAFRDGDQPLADEKQQRILRAAALMEGLRGAAATKYGCDVNGYFGGLPRLPLLPLTGEQTAEIETSLAGLRT